MKNQRLFRIFVSSTFGDFQAEREALRVRVWPVLRDFCRARGASFQAVDLRWGVSASAELEHETMRICLDEIAHCQRLSPRPNFLVLVGDRYGWRPTPAAVPAEEFERILAYYGAEAAAQDLLHAWYRRDDNAVPAEYVLQPRRGVYAQDAAAWVTIERDLQGRLRTAATALNLPRARYFYSATHWESVHGALDASGVPEAAAQVLACFRRLEGLPTEPAGLATAGQWLDLTAEGQRDTEAALELARLRTDLRARLAEGGWVYDCAARWTGEGPWGITTDHLEALCRAVETGLCALIERELAQEVERDAVARERDAHQKFAEERGAVFVGREGLRAEIAAYLAVPPGPSSAPGSGGGEAAAKAGVPPVLVHGPGGVGKSALLAQTGLQAARAHPQAVRVARFIGATPESVEARPLLETLCRELAQGYGQDETLPEGDFKTLIATFTQRLGFARPDRPLLLWLDAVDQLVEHGGETPYAWLPPHLPPAVRLVVSVLDGPAGDAVRQRLPEARQLPVPPMTDSEAETMLEAQLAVATPTQPPRRLTPDQRQAVLTGLRSSGLPLWLTVAISVARRWRSYDPARVLAAELTTLLDQRLLVGLEKRHGPVLVRQAIRSLLASRYGLSDEELRDVLWRDADVRAEFDRRKHPDQPPVDALPPIIWSRLYFELEPYLRVRRAQGIPCYGFFHRQIGESWRALCLPADLAPTCHAHLAAYFQDQGYRDAARRPRLRTLAELPWQQTQAGQHAHVERTLTDFDFAMAKAEAGDLEDLADDYHRALAIMKPPPQTFRLWENFFRSRRHLLRRADAGWPAHKILLQLAVEHADDSPVTQAAERWLDQGFCDWVWLRNPQRVPAAGIDPCTVLLEGERITGVQLSPDGRLLSWGNKLRMWNLATERCVAVLEGHTGDIEGVRVLADGRLLSWDEKTLRLWDGTSGAPLAVLAGHTGKIEGVRELADGRLLSWAKDGTLRLWDGITGICMLEVYTEEINNIQILTNGRILSWTYDSNLRLWNELNGTLLATFIGHNDWIIDTIELEEKQILSWSYDNTLRLWDSNGTPLTVLAGHTDWVAGAMELGSSRILSWAQDSTLRLWHRLSGTPLAVLKGHTENVIGAAALADSRILSWAGDGTLRLWDGASGAPLAVLEGHTGPVRGATALADGRLLSWAEDGTLRLWDGTSGASLVVLKGHTREISGAKVLADGRILSWSRDQSLRLWDGVSGNPLVMLAKHTNWVTGVTMLADGRILSWSRDQTLRLWDGVSGKPLVVLEGHIGTVKGAMMLADGRILSWSRDQTLRLWDSSSGTMLEVLAGHTDWVSAATILANGGILSWSEDGAMRLWDGASGAHLAVLEGHTGPARGATALADGRLLSWAADGVRSWDLTTGQGTLLIPALGTVGGVLTDGRLLSWAGGSLRFWALETGHCLAVREEHGQEEIQGYRELPPDRLVTWSKESIRLWDTRTYQPLAMWPTDPLRSLTWTIQIEGDHEPVIQLDNCFLWDPASRSLRAMLPLDCNAPDRWRELLAACQPIQTEYEDPQTALIRCGGPVPMACWQGESSVTTRHLLEDGTLVVSLASGHVFCLKLYRGNRRIGLSELLVDTSRS